jgi:molybdate/tungstate transport system permease protein
MAHLGIDFIGKPAGIAMAMAFVSLPFLLNAAREGFASIPLRLEQAALNLGATPSQVFFTISLPLAWRSILSGLIMMFARGMSEFGAVVIIAYHPMTSSVMFWGVWFKICTTHCCIGHPDIIDILYPTQTALEK